RQGARVALRPRPAGHPPNPPQPRPLSLFDLALCFIILLGNLSQDGRRSENLLGSFRGRSNRLSLARKMRRARIGDPETHPASSRAAQISASICSSLRLIAGTPPRSRSRRKVIRSIPARRAAFPEDRRPIS